MAEKTSANDVTSGLTALAGRPVVGPGANSQDALQASLEDAQTALEQRYANPNWFNVAAGFFKPQLGGFAASLGSAAQELGSWQEQQRANQIPLFNVRAQVGAMQAQRQNREAAAKEFEKAKATGFADTNMPDLIATLVSLGGSTEMVDAAKEALAAREKIASTVSTRVGTGAQQAEAITKYPSGIYNVVQDPLSKAAPVDAARRKEELLAQANAIPGSDPAANAALNIDDLQSALYNNEKVKRELAFKDKGTAGAAIDATNKDLRQLGEIRAAVDRPGMDRVLGTTTGSDALSAIATFYKIQNPDTAKVVSQALAQVKLKDPEAFDDFQVLVKKLNENVALARSVLTNPSDTSTGIIGSAKPSIENTQNAIRKMTDLTAHELSSQAQESMYRLGYAGNPTAIHLDPGYGTLQNNLANQRFQLMSAPATAGIKPFYNIYGEFAKNTQPPKPDEVMQTVAKTKNPVAAAPAAAAPQSKRVTAADLRRAAGLE